MEDSFLSCFNVFWLQDALQNHWSLLQRFFSHWNTTEKRKFEKCFLGARVWAPKPVHQSSWMDTSLDGLDTSLPSQIFNTLQAGFEPAQNLSSGLVQWSYAIVITATTRNTKLF